MTTLSQKIRKILEDLQFRTHDTILYYEKHPIQPYNKKDLGKDLDLILNDHLTQIMKEIEESVPMEKKLYFGFVAGYFKPHDYLNWKIEGFNQCRHQILERIKE